MKPTAHEDEGQIFRVTVNREGNRVHRLIDDTNYPLRTQQCIPRRDPMVAALFGAASAADSPAAPAKAKQRA